MSLKIGLFNDSFPPTIDGVANAVKSYAENIEQRYGTPVVITPKYPHVVDRYPYEVYRYSSTGVWNKIPYRVGNPFSPTTINELLKKHLDLFHVHCPFASMVLARQLNATGVFQKHIPTIFTYHTKFDIDIDKFVRNRPLRKVAKQFCLNNIRYADEVWVVSKGAGRDLEQFGYKGEYLVMPNGTDYDHEKAPQPQIDEINRLYRLDPNETVFLFVGRMMWYKNLQLILDTLQLTAKASVPFKAIFVGDGVDRPVIEQYAKNLGLGDRTIFTGAIYDREKIKAYFSRANLFLFPSTYDTSGLVVREAASCDCASLLVRGSCAAEGVQDGVSGLLAEENAENCAKKLVEAVRQNALENLGKAAGEKVYYSWSQAVDKAWIRYEKILQSRKK